MEVGGVRELKNVWKNCCGGSVSRRKNSCLVEVRVVLNSMSNGGGIGVSQFENRVKGGKKFRERFCVRIEKGELWKAKK